jgi:DNA polymerase-4
MQRTRRILHVDLDPFFVSVERSLDPALRGRPVIVGGGDAAGGRVAAASAEARAAGVAPGQSLSEARRLCPEAVIRPGDLERYGRFSEDVTTILLGASRRVERPSADEAYVDLTAEAGPAGTPAATVDAVKDELHRRLGLDASFGIASSRLAARVASSFAKPRGFLVVLPGYEASFLAGKPLSFLDDLPTHLESALTRAGLATLGAIEQADPEALAGLVGPAAARQLQDVVRGEGDPPVEVAAPPAWIQEQATIRDRRRSDRPALEAILDGLVSRACRRLRPFDLGAQAVAVEVLRREGTTRLAETVPEAAVDEERLSAITRGLAAAALEPAAGVRGLSLKLTRLAPPDRQRPLFPEASRG